MSEKAQKLLGGWVGQFRFFGFLSVFMLLPLLAVFNSPVTSDASPGLVTTPTEITIKYDGTEKKFLARAPFVGEAVKESGIPFADGDSTDPYPESSVTKNLVVEVFRAKPVTIYDTGRIIRGESGYNDPEKVLHQLHDDALDEDIVTQSIINDSFLDSGRLGRLITVKRAPRIKVKVDGQTTEYASWASSVADLLGKKGIALLGKDYTVPALSVKLTDGMKIRVYRVREINKVKQTVTNFSTVLEYNSHLGFWDKKTVQSGRDGIFDQTYRYRYEDGILRWIHFVKAKTLQSLKNFIIARGARFSANYASNGASFYGGISWPCANAGAYTAAVGYGLRDVPNCTKLRVLNLSNGLSVDVVVTDTCSCYNSSNGRKTMIDLSEAAFSQIWPTWKGLIPKIRVQVVSTP